MTRDCVSDPDVPADAGSLQKPPAILRRGGIVAYPTDTLYGLAVDPRNDAAVETAVRREGPRRGARRSR